MITGKGKSVYQGISIGKAYFFKKKELRVSQEMTKRPEDDIEALENVYQIARAQLQKLYQKTKEEIGEEEAAIIDVQIMMMDDLDYREGIEARIREEKKNLAWAIEETGKAFAEIFSNMDSDYMRGRATDVRDVSSRLVRIALGDTGDMVKLSEPVILVAEDLAPSETVQFDTQRLLGFVIKKGSSNSHTAILARTMGVPALIGADILLSEELHGKTIIVDGYEGKYYLEPEEEFLKKMEEKQKEDVLRKQELEKLIGKESVTLSGKKVLLYANIGKAEDVDAVLKNDAEGIGLFRSEFLYLGKDTYPTEEEQYQSYRHVTEKMQGKKVVIRTLDIGADKKADYFQLGEEENPALGYRAIRICLEQTDVFKTQLRAILRAAAHGTVSIMFPMIISVNEIRKAKEILNQAREELKQENIKFGDAEIGIMIETPAAVMMADELAKEVSFFSVGTNDLTQYTLAIDRQNEKLDSFYDSHHPAILKMLKMIVESAHRNGIWAGICGELAADTTLSETFLEMGYDELSVSCNNILGLRKKIREIQ